MGTVQQITNKYVKMALKKSVLQITFSSAPQQLKQSVLQNIPTSVQQFMKSLATLCRISSAGMSLFKSALQLTKNSAGLRINRSALVCQNAQQFTTNNAPLPTEPNATGEIRKKSCSSDLLQLLQLLDFIVQALALLA